MKRMMIALALCVAVVACGKKDGGGGTAGEGAAAGVTTFEVKVGMGESVKLSIAPPSGWTDEPVFKPGFKVPGAEGYVTFAAHKSSADAAAKMTEALAFEFADRPVTRVDLPDGRVWATEKMRNGLHSGRMFVGFPGGYLVGAAMGISPESKLPEIQKGLETLTYVSGPTAK